MYVLKWRFRDVKWLQLEASQPALRPNNGNPYKGKARTNRKHKAQVG